MDIYKLATYALLILISGGGLFFISLQILRTDQISRRLKEFVEEDESKQIMRQQVVLGSRQFSGSLLSRLFIPIFKNITQFFGQFTPVGINEYIRRQLVIAGNPNNLGPREIFGLSIALGIPGAFLGFLLLQRGLTLVNLLLAGLTMIMSVFAPIYWLRLKVISRQNKIRKGLPDALDMLSICATAGLGFDQAMQRIADYWSTPIGMEFGRVITEIEMGITRRDALRNMADRVQVNEVNSFTAFIIQSEQIGMSISDTLRTHAGQIRVERRFKAQEQAQKIPSKMLLPLVFLIFPALLAVILGPALPDLMSIFENL